MRVLHYSGRMPNPPLWRMLDFMNDKFRSSDSEEGVDIGLPTLLIALAAALSGRVCMGEGAVCLCREMRLWPCRPSYIGLIE